MAAPYNYLTLNGTNQYVSIPCSARNDFTIEFWFRSTQGLSTSTNWWSGAGLIDGEVGGYVMDLGISLNANGCVLAGGGTGYTIVSQTGLNDGNWHHVAYTRNSITGGLTLYIDGVLSATGAATAGTYSAPPQLTIGRILAGGNFFAGDIGEIRLWSAIRTIEQINEYKDKILEGSHKNLKAYYKTVSETTLIDSSLNENNGIIYNVPTFTNNNTEAVVYQFPVVSGTLTIVNPTNGTIITDGLITISATYTETSEVKTGQLMNINIMLDKFSAFNTPYFQKISLSDISDGSSIDHTLATKLLNGDWYLKIYGESEDIYCESDIINFKIVGASQRAISFYESVSISVVSTNKRALSQYENIIERKNRRRFVKFIT